MTANRFFGGLFRRRSATLGLVALVLGILFRWPHPALVLEEALCRSGPDFCYPSNL